MNKQTKLLSIIFGTIFGGIIAFNFAKKIIVNYLFTHYKPPAITVTATETKRFEYRPHISTIGSFEAINGVEVGSQVPGIINKIYFKSGQFVKKGSPLIALDDSVEQADLKISKSDLNLQESDFKRQKELIAHNATSPANLDRAKAKLQDAEARVEKVVALIRQKHIRAPFSGFLGIRQVDLGEYVKPGETNIVSLESLDPIFLKFSIPEHLVNKLKINQKIHFSIEQYPNRIFKGTITAINSKSDKNSHNIEIQATVANCPVKLLTKKHVLNDKPTIVECSSKINKQNKIANYAFIPGTFVNITIPQTKAKSNIIVPSTAISYSMYGDSVFVIEKTSEKGTKNPENRFIVKKVYVKAGEQEGNYTIIKKGLKPGQLIVSSGEFKLQDGNEIALNNDLTLPTLNVAKIGR